MDPQTTEINPPLTTMKELLIYDYQHVLLQPTVLNPVKPSKSLRRVRSQPERLEAKRTFPITSSQMEIIKTGETIRHPNSPMDYVLHRPVQVQLRFCLVDPDQEEQPDFLPTDLQVTLNGSKLDLPRPIHGQANKRPAVPINVPHASKVHSGVNTITVSWKPDPKDCGSLAMSVNIVKLLTAQESFKKLMRKGCRPEVYTRNRIREIIGVGGEHDDDDALITEKSIRVSVICPISRRKMSYPCQARSCRHIQCFDGEAFLLLNHNKDKCLCPICDEEVKREELLIDDYFSKLCGRLSLERVEQVDLFPDGHWEAVNVCKNKRLINIKNAAAAAPPPFKRIKKEVTSDDDDNDDEKVPSSTAAATAEMIKIELEEDSQDSVIQPGIENIPPKSNKVIVISKEGEDDPAASVIQNSAKDLTEKVEPEAVKVVGISKEDPPASTKATKQPLKANRQTTRTQRRARSSTWNRTASCNAFWDDMEGYWNDMDAYWDAPAVHQRMPVFPHPGTLLPYQASHHHQPTNTPPPHSYHHPPPAPFYYTPQLPPPLHSNFSPPPQSYHQHPPSPPSYYTQQLPPPLHSNFSPPPQSYHHHPPPHHSYYSSTAPLSFFQQTPPPPPSFFHQAQPPPPYHHQPSPPQPFCQYTPSPPTIYNITGETNITIDGNGSVHIF